MANCLLGIDLGTTGCKSMLFNSKLEILGEAYIEYPLINIDEKKIEQDAEQWWQLTKEVVKDSLTQANVRPKDIKGISVSSQGIAFVPVDKNGHPLDNAVSWLDTRAREEKQEILQQYSEEHIFKITGKRINESYVLPKLMWLKQHKPDIYDKTYKFLMGHDYLLAKLSGHYVTDHTMASGTLIYDIIKQDWSTEICQKFAIEIDKLPQIKWSGTSIGSIDTDIARELGLKEDTRIVVGGQDQKCAALGSGIKKGVATVSLGTATAVTTKWQEPVVDELRRIPCFSDLLKNHWVTEGVIGTSGASLKWLQQTLFPEKDYFELDNMVSETCPHPTELFFYPHLAGASSPFWFDKARGFFYGINLATGAAEIVKSVFEGIAFQIKSNLEVMDEIGGNIEELRVFGGGARSEIWCQIIADITDKKIVIPSTSETANLGAAILAGIGCNIYKDVEAAKKYQNIDKEFNPDKEKVDIYQEKYQEYLEIQHKMMGEK